MSKLVFETPSAVKAELEPLFAPYEWLIPDWCREVLVCWEPHQDERASAAITEIRYEYRWARITFYPLFIEQRELSKKELVLHELLHVHSCLLNDYMVDTVSDLLTEDEQPQFRAHVLEGIRCRHESFVQDMALCLVNRFKEAA